MGKNVLVIAANGFEDVEMIAVRDILIRSGHDVDIASITRNDEDFITSLMGLRIKVDKKIENILGNLSKYDAIFLPGGPGTEKIDLSREIDEILEHFVKTNKFIGAICAAPTILAKRGYLKGKKAICYPDPKFQKILIKNGAKLVSTNCTYKDDCAVVRDGKIMTGLEMKTSIEFGIQFANFIDGR